MQIQQTTGYDYARLRFASGGTEPDTGKTVPFPAWDIAVGANQMNFFVQGRPGDGNIMSLRSDGVTKVKVLQITGGADVAEPFNMSSGDIKPGAVVIIDEEHPGQLTLSDRACDTRVAGIVSGANGVQPGISLTQHGVVEGGENVALSGRLYVQADDSNGPIRPGDLLTTSVTPGYAMQVTDHL